MSSGKLRIFGSLIYIIRASFVFLCINVWITSRRMSLTWSCDDVRDIYAYWEASCTVEAWVRIFRFERSLNANITRQDFFVCVGSAFVLELANKTRVNHLVSFRFADIDWSEHSAFYETIKFFVSRRFIPLIVTKLRKTRMLEDFEDFKTTIIVAGNGQFESLKSAFMRRWFWGYCCADRCC